MIPQLGYDYGIILDFVDNAMFIGNSAGPISGKTMSERLRFANLLLWHALNVTN